MTKILVGASCTMAAFVYNGREVYNAKDIKEKYPVFFHGCGERIKDVVEKRSIPPEIVTYVIKTADGWNPSTAHIKKSAVLLDKTWVDENIPKFLEEGVTTSAGKTYLPAPNILELTDKEKLRDTEGNIYEIKIRGERVVDKCYFRSSDIEAMLEMKNITGTLQRSTTDRDAIKFEQNIHYQTFISDAETNGSVPGFKCPVLYLTYAGLVQLLFVRRHPIAKKFQRWATETLFTASLGTPEAKKELAGKLLGVELCDIKAFLATDTDIMPVIYLFVIGRIGDLRKEMKIDTAGTFDDTGLVAKFGYTTNLRDRAADHYRTYGKIPGTRVYLRCYTRIEPAHLSKAESALREYFKRCECLITDNKTHKELVVLDEKFVERKIKTVYKDIGKLYEGRCAETRKLDEGIDKMIDIQDKIVTNQQISHDKLFSTSDKLIAMYEERLAEKDAKIAKRDAKLAEKDIIIKNLTSRLSFNA